MLENSAESDDVVKSKDHFRLGRILLELGEYSEAQDHAKSGIESFDDPKNSEEYCTIMFLAIYQRRDYLFYFKHPERFHDLEDVVERLETLHGLRPEDSQILFILAASSACLNFSECRWQAMHQQRTLPDEVLKYFQMYFDLPESSGATKEKKRLLGEIQMTMFRDRLFGPIETPPAH